MAEAPFDLIVLSELGYFLDAAAMQQVSAAVRCNALAPDGTLVACDWRADFDERTQVLDHARSCHAGRKSACPGWSRMRSTISLLQVWSRDRRSVAARDGIR